MQNNQALAIGIMIVAAALRLAAPHEYEFKADEQAMVEMVQHARASGDLPWLGMPTSQGFRNPGLSAWPFVALSFFSGTTGFGLTQAVRIMNVLAFALALLWALRMRGETQKLWLLGLMLAAVNPLDIVLHRKLWAQSILPIFGLCVTWCWWNRKRHWGYALGLGASAAVISQIHLSGLFFSAALFAAALLDQQRKKVGWWAMAAGLITLGWPMIFWVQHLWVAYESSLHGFETSSPCVRSTCC